MASFKTIRLSDIAVPPRLRDVEEEHAIAIAQSIVEHGLINPITVRATPAAKSGKYTLVAGAHRLRAFQLNDEDEIDAIVVEADKLEAQLVEITENLFRNELSVIDRATFVSAYREIWEQRHGKVAPGRPGNSANLSQLFQTETAGFASHVAERMGLSRRAIFRLGKIAKLHADVRSALRGTPTADNQSQLLKIAKLEPQRQRELATAIGLMDHDVERAWSELAAVRPKSQPDEDTRQKAVLLKLQAAWDEASEETREEFLSLIGQVPDTLLADLRREVVQ
ncbi:ParB/RepB/Spo0J family partition protein [Rhizobium halophytocola]|uniref:ParB family chromosome partitioning protein n=1 Tax=Rhizobium halophytocola TaxID=735519 RepID=A0ABS4E437_9HYPH|nr:ParB/RepB/Spo0J family partition protein [Rhizobium halophytocola]MBP1852717.1 ParB family chromosome partitioning protein [Rhizobium halophytocola]